MFAKSGLWYLPFVSYSLPRYRIVLFLALRPTTWLWSLVLAIYIFNHCLTSFLFQSHQTCSPTSKFIFDRTEPYQQLHSLLGQENLLSKCLKYLFVRTPPLNGHRILYPKFSLATLEALNAGESSCPSRKLWTVLQASRRPASQSICKLFFLKIDFPDSLDFHIEILNFKINIHTFNTIKQSSFSISILHQLHLNHLLLALRWLLLVPHL